jgi:hypothetical protein
VRLGDWDWGKRGGGGMQGSLEKEKHSQVQHHSDY